MPESSFVNPMSHLEGNVCSVVGHVAGRGIIGLPVLMVLSTLGLLGRLLSPLTADEEGELLAFDVDVGR